MPQAWARGGGQTRTGPDPPRIPRVEALPTSRADRLRRKGATLPVAHRKVRPHLIGIICGLGAVAAMLPSIFPAGASVSAGTVTRIVGTGEQGFAGDGGPATLAELYQPRVLAFDQAGN